MCGIAGSFRFDRQAIDYELLKRMSDLQKHRGPDDEGSYIEDNIGFGFRRLSVLDLSEKGHQPMANADKSNWIIFNGEIYNHNDLRVELERCGQRFRSSTDTEVILAAYDQWGINCLNRFNGMWAFAIWDKYNKKLFCSRDRMGIKPFYYHVDDKRFLFSSEIKALFADDSTPCRPNDLSILNYLVFGKVHFSESTFYQEIYQLPAAHYMLIDDNGISIKRYWEICHDNYNENISNEDAEDQFRMLFLDSIRIHLQSDVPVGSCLSGGLDSSSIVCVANEILFGRERNKVRTIIGEKQQTFSACYSDERYDERKWIKHVIDKTNAQSHEVFPTAEEMMAELGDMLWHQDEPVAGSSVYAQWCVMRRAKQAGVIVMLDGQGADELLGGYEHYNRIKLAGMLRSARLTSFFQEIFLKASAAQGISNSRDFLNLMYVALPDSIRLYIKKLYGYVMSRLWLGRELKFQTTDQSNTHNHASWLGMFLNRDLLVDSLPALLRYEDRNSMAHSIESRLPFLDYRIVEMLTSLPDRMKIRRGRTKWLLRQALRNTLPDEIVNRGDKVGFETPEKEWLHRNIKYIKATILGGEIIKRQWLNDESKRILNEFEINKSNKERIIWRWLNAELWLRQMNKK